MSRNIDSALMAAFSAGQVVPVVLVMIKLKTTTEYVWSGVGPLVWNGWTFTGVGILGEVGNIREEGEGKAEGTTLTLSGLDLATLGEALTDVRVGAPAKIWLGALGSSGLIGTPYLLFSGIVDKPGISVGADTVSITVPLESRMINHARANQRRYTAADQHANGYPDDSGFNFVEELNDQALVWGS